MSTLLPPKSKQTNTPIPPLQAGDHLSRAEFERRYEAMPHVNKAELIDGVVYMPSPVSYANHGSPHYSLLGWTVPYSAATPGVRGADNTTLKLDLNNEPQPDLFLLLRPEVGGKVQLDEKGYAVGAPELVAEVAASSASYDLHVKLHAYRRNGVREYIVWRVLDQAIDWFVLVGDQYEPLPLSAEGWYRSRVFPGLWLDPQALIADDLPRVLQVAQQGIADPEHQRFVAELAQRRSAR